MMDNTATKNIIPTTFSSKNMIAKSYFNVFYILIVCPQLIEALHYLHYTSHQMHRNVCPQVIIVTKRGTWKLFGLEFAGT